MARPRRQIYTMKQYLDNEKEGYIKNNLSTQRNPKWKPIIDGLVVTILTDDYIPPIILAEEDCGRIDIVDGGSRTTAFKIFAKGNYKIKSSVEDPIIKYKKMDKDENGKTVWSDAEFDIRNKTFEQFPKELQKKFYEYQVETVIHECDAEQAAKYLRRYNEHTGMNANEKMFIHLPKFADEVRKIINKQFFINYSNFTENEKDKGMLERVVSESVMCMFHFDKWNKNGKKMATYLNKNATVEEFEIFEKNVSRLENIITDETKGLFNSKDTFVWMTLFNKFSNLGMDDSKFAEFLNVFVDGLREKSVDGKLFDTIDEIGSTKDKNVIINKLHILETLMNEFLHINKEDLEEIDVFEFIKENIKLDATEEDIAEYKEDLEILSLDLDNTSKLLEERNLPSLIAIIAYGYKEDIFIDKWLVNFFKQNNTYILNQKRNYLYMKKDLDNYIKSNKGKVQVT